MKKLLSVLLLICLLLTSCNYSDVSDLTSNNFQSGNDPTVQEGSNPYGNYDYSLKPYFSGNFFFIRTRFIVVDCICTMYHSGN